MIAVVPRPEPADFAVKVRLPGQNYLAKVPAPNLSQFKKHNYWKFALGSLKTAYGSVCAYSSFWMPSNCSVDHFQPKSVCPDLAYEWTNYRLANDKINANKGNSIEILDPFYVQDGWFILDFATLWVTPEPSLSDNVKKPIQKSIEVLRLNDDQWVQMRFEIFRSYLKGELNLPFLLRNYPFIAAEIQRQNINV